MVNAANTASLQMEHSRDLASFLGAKPDMYLVMFKYGNQFRKFSISLFAVICSSLLNHVAYQHVLFFLYPLHIVKIHVLSISTQLAKRENKISVLI